MSESSDAKSQTPPPRTSPVGKGNATIVRGQTRDLYSHPQSYSTGNSTDSNMYAESTTDTMQANLPTSTDGLIFPLASQNFSQTLTSLKRSKLSIRNRLASILEDSSFVLRVAKCNALPLVANERCGNWYIPPEKKSGSVYFKSTDGHSGQWSFSTRRLNLQLLGLLEKHQG